MFTRWTMAVPTQRSDAFCAATFLYQYVFCTFGPITPLLSDNGAHFSNQVLREYCKLVNTYHKFTTRYYSQWNGTVEKFNGTLVTSLKKLSQLKPKTWDEYLPMVLYSYRGRSHEAITMPPICLCMVLCHYPTIKTLFLLFGRSLGFQRFMQLPELHQKSLQK